MHRLSAVILALCVVALGSQRASAQLRSQHTFIGDSPSHGQPGWHAGTQGLAHDRNNWYVTNTYNDKTRSLLWRIPVTTNLASDVVCGRGGVSCSDLSDLRLHAYNHYGDPDVYEFNGRVYVLVPLESDDATAPAGIVIFRADETADETLKFLTFTHLTGQAGAPWVAVDGDGIIYSSSFDTQAVINRFYLDWISFQANERVRPTLVPVDPLLLQDKTGKAFDLDKAQGGEFSDDGRRFYLSNGDGRDEAEPSEGLHVFHTAIGDQCGPGSGHCLVARQIERSHNSDDPGFSFEFHPGPNFGATGQEPEGLTFWDLDADGRAPGMGGQLHVVLLDNDYTDQEEVYVKHYSSYTNGGGLKPAPADYDGDGKVDIAAKFDSGDWRIDLARNGFGVWDLTYPGYGSISIPVPADYDGDCRADFSVKDNYGLWKIDYAANGFGFWDVRKSGFGGADYHPVPADYDGDGKADLAVKGDIYGDWYIDYARDGFGGYNPSYGGFGGAPYHAVPADYDGDGKADLAVKGFFYGDWYIDYARDGFGGYNPSYGGFGGAPYHAVPADYDGDGKADLAVKGDIYGDWYIDYAHDGFGGYNPSYGGFRGPDFEAVPADYDGDGKADLAILGSDNRWYIDFAASPYDGWNVIVPIIYYYSMPSSKASHVAEAPSGTTRSCLSCSCAISR